MNQTSISHHAGVCFLINYRALILVVLRSGLLFTLAAAFLSFFGTGVGAAEALSARQAIDKGHKAYVAAMLANDCSAILRLLSDDVVFVPPNAPLVSGKAAVAAWCEEGTHKVRTIFAIALDRKVEPAGDWAIEHGRFDEKLVPVGAGGPMREQGNFVAVWHRQGDGSWRITRNIWVDSQVVSPR